MPKSTTASFIHELKLKITPHEKRVLSKRLEAGRQLYNACLGESLKRLRQLRESKIYQKARHLPREQKNATGKRVANAERKQLFKEASHRFGFSEYALHKYLTQTYSKSWLTGHIDSLTAQKIASRAFGAVSRYAYGQGGKPRFKSKGRFQSVEGKNNASGIRFVDGKVLWSIKGKEKLILRPQYDDKDKDGLEAHALSCKTKYVRLVERQGHWSVQLVQTGSPYKKAKHHITKATVGLDIGPSTIAIVGETQATLQAFCKDVIDYQSIIKYHQRALSRSLRLNNPGNFKSGNIAKGQKRWAKSERYQQRLSVVKQLQRKMAAARKCAHGWLANQIIGLGNTIKTEKLSYKAFQKQFGKSVGARAPGLFLNLLRRKAESAGGEVIEFNTRTTALSQRCHCGAREKKTLSTRWHNCKTCGISAQRDLYSAFLARFVDNEQLDTSQAQKAWAGVDMLLARAVSSLEQTAIGKARLASFGLRSKSELFACEMGIGNP